MTFKNFDTISQPVRAQIERVTEAFHKRFGDDLTGVYVHGSMALDSFVEETSDIDMLIVVSRRIPRGERLELAREMIEIDGNPAAVELSAVLDADINPWQQPPACQFHYSDFWTERYKKMLSGEIAESFIIDEDFRDPDVTSYARLIRQCGIRVFGKPADEVFPVISDEDFWASISADADDYDFSAYEPRYFASNILILARILSFRVFHRILSKYEASVWAENALPEEFKKIITAAKESWFEGKSMPVFPETELDELKNYLINHIKAQ